MAETQLSVSWDAYQSKICSGLGLLQQRGEFVDLTLAADGHHVKVHQMVMSLVSPYIKELISSAQCPHPVIFLNNVSYSTLSTILEYIYTGEILLSQEKLPDVLSAAKALHILGLMDMNVIESPQNEDMKDPIADLNIQPRKKTLVEQLREHKENKKHNVKTKSKSPQPICKILIEDNSETIDMIAENESTEISYIGSTHNEMKALSKTTDEMDMFNKSKQNVQYSISNQGGLQMICNRYLYTLKYVQKKLTRFWRCVDSAYKKCPATIYTNEKNEVIKRKFSHNHPFHDQKIFKKVRRGIVFAAYNEAEAQCKKSDNKNEKSCARPSEDRDTATDSE